ncbi:MAG: aminopeptidase P family protein [Burkholderiales bacterium]|nr:aminopeptidase P family protein [Burkholderiales bacterium]
MDDEQIFPRFSEAEYERRERAVRAEMEKRGLDALVIVGDSGSRGANHANVYWLTNWQDPGPAYVLMAAGAGPSLMISNSLYLHSARRAGRARETNAFVYGSNPGEQLAQQLADWGCSRGRIGIVGVRNVGRTAMSAEHRDALAATLPQATFVDALDVLAEARRLKSAEELAWFQRGAEFTDKIIERLSENVRVGMPEYELLAINAEAVLRDGGNLRLQYMGATSMENPEIIFPWQYPSTRRIQRGDVLLTEISASYGLYAGQIHRPFSIGSRPTPEYQQLYEVAAEAYHRVVEALRPGATDHDVRAAAADIDRKGYRTYDALLHGWGVHIEDPRLDIPSAMIKRPQMPVVFQAGMLMVIQPNVVTADGKRGLQAGGLVVIEEGGARPMHRYPMQFIRVD